MDGLMHRPLKVGMETELITASWLLSLALKKIKVKYIISHRHSVASWKATVIHLLFVVAEKAFKLIKP